VRKAGKDAGLVGAALNEYVNSARKEHTSAITGFVANLVADGQQATTRVTRLKDGRPKTTIVLTPVKRTMKDVLAELATLQAEKAAFLANQADDDAIEA
jgi:hypothetical protein